MFHVKHHSVDVRHVSRETYDKCCQKVDESEGLKEYASLLFRENQKVNLISRRMSEDVFREHLIHCLLASELSLIESNTTYVDAGTGGGLPGLPLAILSSDSVFLLNDKSVKKQISLQRIVNAMQLENVSCHQGDISSFRIDRMVVLLSKHAFKLKNLIKETSMLSKKRMIVWKGEDFFDELRILDKPTLHVVAFDLSGLGDFYEGKYILDIRM